MICFEVYPDDYDAEEGKAFFGYSILVSLAISIILITCASTTGIRHRNFIQEYELTKENICNKYEYIENNPNNIGNADLISEIEYSKRHINDRRYRKNHFNYVFYSQYTANMKELSKDSCKNEEGIKNENI